MITINGMLYYSILTDHLYVIVVRFMLLKLYIIYIYILNVYVDYFPFGLEWTILVNHI